MRARFAGIDECGESWSIRGNMGSFGGGFKFKVRKAVTVEVRPNTRRNVLGEACEVRSGDHLSSTHERVIEFSLATVTLRTAFPI